jgi:hypothetical protein
MSQRIGQINEKLLAQLKSRPDASPIIAAQSQPGLNEGQIREAATTYQKAMAEYQSGTSHVTVADFNKFYVLTAYTSIHQRVAEKIQKIVNSVDGIRDFYLVEVILSQLTEDALAPKIGSDEVIKFSHKDPDVTAFVTDMKARIGLDQIIENIVPDLCAYGDYIMETDIKVGDGLNGLYDNVEPGQTVPLIQDGRVDGYLHTDEVSNVVEKRELCDFVHFTLGGQRIKVRFDQSLPYLVKNNAKLREYYKKTPKYLRVGRSMLYPVLGKLRELELMEKLVPATKINKLSQGNTVGVPVPEGYDLQRGFEAAKAIENNINRKVMIDNTLKEITVEAILSTAGRTRVIPVFGEKGRLEKLDYRDSEADDDLANNAEMREIICDSIGVPAELVFKSKNSEKKGDLLKRYAKYLRKLKKIQKSVINGVRQVLAIHLANSDRYKHVDPDTIEIILNNHLIEIDNLDRLEHADITISFIKNVKEFFDSLIVEGSPYKKHVRMSKVVSFIEEQLKTVGLADAIETADELVSDGDISQEQASADDNLEDAESDGNVAPIEDEPNAQGVPTVEPKYSSIPFDPTKPPAPKKAEAVHRVTESRKQNFTKAPKVNT